jgi:hypothetical protein
MILDGASALPVLGASLFIEETKQSTISDQNGEFTLNVK